MLVENIATSNEDNSTICIVGRIFEKLSSFFNLPCDFQFLGIYEASILSDINSWPINVIQEKVMHIPLSDVKSCIIPFLHN